MHAGGFMAVKLKPDVFVNTNPFLDAMNKERLNHKGYSDKIAVSINNKKSVGVCPRSFSRLSY